MKSTWAVILVLLAIVVSLLPSAHKSSLRNRFTNLLPTTLQTPRMYPAVESFDPPGTVSVVPSVPGNAEPQPMESTIQNTINKGSTVKIGDEHVHKSPFVTNHVKSDMKCCDWPQMGPSSTDMGCLCNEADYLKTAFD